MLILDARHIEKYYGDRLIIAFNQLKIYKGDKIGIVGHNGAGKSTLLNILSGDVMPDDGIVKRFCDIAYIRQFENNDIDANAMMLKEFEVKDQVKNRVISGGEQTRLKIAGALSQNNIILLADEPTANLDYNGIKKLKKKLQQIETLLIISHDRDLLNSLCDKIVEVNNGKLSFYEGDYTFYQEQKRLEKKHQWAEYHQYVQNRSSLEDALTTRKKQSDNIRKAPSRMGNSEARLHKGKTSEKKKKIDKASNIIKKRIEKLEIKEKPQEIARIKLDFSLSNPPKNRIIISSDDLNFKYGNRPIFNNCRFKINNGEKTAVIGDNGVGKTTLLNLINGRDKRIKIAPRAVFGYFFQGLENLDPNWTILENVMQESIQNETAVRIILARLLIKEDDVYKKVKVLSGGEKIKVSLARLMVSNANVLLLDEPTNYLDLFSIKAFEQTLNDYEGTVLLVSHDRAFVNATASRLLVIKDKQIVEFEGRLQAFEERQRDLNSNKDLEIQKDILKMRLSLILAKMSQPNCNKDELESEYQIILTQLRNI